MKRVLTIWVHEQKLGQVFCEQDVWGFQYHADWLKLASRFALSPALPLQQKSFRDEHSQRPVQWFFDNLLPEGPIREALARFAHLPVHDSFALLQTYGAESAGALSLMPEDQEAPGPSEYRPLTREDLHQLIAELPKSPLLVAKGRARMSLAGAQHKLGIHRRGEHVLLPIKGAASSWIIKPDNAQNKEFPFCPANEHFCMRLARKLGIAVPQTELWHVPEPLYLVQRFDREIKNNKVQRLHQIDLCQLLNKWPGYKYESDGGASFVESYRALDATRQPALARQQMLRWFIFNYLTGNSDAHAKNIAFMVSPQGLQLAPAYDLLNVRVYGPDYDYMAMTIGEEVRYQWVQETQWNKLADSIALPRPTLRKIRSELARAMPLAARSLLKAPDWLQDEREFIEKVVASIEELCTHSLKEA